MKIIVTGYKKVEEVYEVDDKYAILADDEWVDENSTEYCEMSDALLTECDKQGKYEFRFVERITNADGHVMVEE